MSGAIQKYNETCFKEFSAYYKLRKNHCRRIKHIKYIKCWYKLAVVKESGWGHCWKALWKEWVWRRRRGESHLRWNSLEDLSGPDTNSSAWGELYPWCWRKMTSYLKRQLGEGGEEWGRLDWKERFYGGNWRSFRRSQWREDKRKRGNNLDVWNLQDDNWAWLELVKEHWLQMVLGWFLGAESIHFYMKCRQIVNKTRVEEQKALFN